MISFISLEIAFFMEIYILVVISYYRGWKYLIAHDVPDTVAGQHDELVVRTDRLFDHIRER